MSSYSTNMNLKEIKSYDLSALENISIVIKMY